MAYNNSDLLGTEETYTLGDYEFRLSVSAASVMALCHNNKTGEGAAKGKSWSSQLQVDGWYVEANETEASVYVAVKGSGSSFNCIEITLDTPTTNHYLKDYYSTYVIRDKGSSASPIYAGHASQPTTLALTKYYRSDGPNVPGYYIHGALLSGNPGERLYFTSTYGYMNEFTLTEFQTFHRISVVERDLPYHVPISEADPEGGKYHPEITEGDYLVARFAIDLREAGGGPGGWSGGVWDEPGDVEPVDWEPGDPTHTLTLTVTGALSGRHNDPLFDTSYSYLPADQDSIKGYGFGGDGGHGGGGGGGASTVIVRQFATSKASSKEIKAYARRHGYGSGGGKGGTGGDGCILIFY